ncbi:MAG: endonuclease/exonuclease/phosphatase family protein [Allomuricauda sp.]|nr:MAG: endonuclease/exonuclease/phosphatase family protein [Allomuricauda sp.]
MAMRYFFGLILFTIFYSNAQKNSTYHVRAIAFYNVENLFDITNDTLIFDDERTPEGTYRWTNTRYKKKIGAISRVIANISSSVTSTSPDLIGLCEVENFKVLNDLINAPLLIKKDYGIIHFNSPDSRGIDVALLYKKAAYHPTSFKSHRLLLFDDDYNRNYTRDQLVVGGYLDGEKVYLIIIHWPSRRGGEAFSQPLRKKAASLTKRIIDSLNNQHFNSKIIVMGDFNDDPKNASLKKVLRTKGQLDHLDSISLFNPMENLFKKGIGSLAYRDKWNLFDQFLLTPNFISEMKNGYTFWKAGVYNPLYLQIQNGRYKGYPLRTYGGTTYQGGYSDHFPVYLYVIKKADPGNSKK